MRLEKIKLNGFKSFAEVVTIEFPSNMIGVVGPNGCGKSNIVDAVRWVMGGTSRNVRATTLEDVVFSGTNARKPMGLASVELIFDNAAGAGGKFSQYTELSLRRTATRDRDSKYYINGTRCRRRDVADIFFGTGLGANSYAVIEQGMISRVIEAKPEEMRGYVEEAAGVSQYKERRRDTENRIRHTRDNLERVIDIRDEVAKQLNKLKRQVKSAEKFKQLRKDKERFESELLLLRYRRRAEERAAGEKEVAARRADFEKVQASLHEAETEAEQKRAAAAQCNDELNRLKEAHYRLGADVTGKRQDIENRGRSIERLSKEREEVTAMAKRNLQEIDKQQALLADKERRLAELDKEVERLGTEVGRLREERTVARQMLRDTARKHQSDIDRIGEEVAELRDKVHDLTEALHAEQRKSSDVQGRLASLEALQEAELRDDQGAFTEWLEAAGLTRKDRFIERVHVADGWERAVETVLGAFIAGVEVASLEEHAVRVGDFDKGTLVLFEPHRGDAAGGTLADKVTGSKSAAGLLGQVQLADDLEQALSRRSSLKPHESLITRDGAWVGPNWVKLHVPDKEGEGMLVRERRIETLGQRLEESTRASEALKKDVAAARADLVKKEAQRDEVQARLASALKEAAALESVDEQPGGSALEEVRAQLRVSRETLHRAEVECEAVKAGCDAMRGQVKQLQSLKEELAQRRRSLDETLGDLEKPMDESRRRLDVLLEQQTEGQRRLGRQEAQLVELQSQVEAVEHRRAGINDEVETRRETYERARADLQVVAARCKDTLAEIEKLKVPTARLEAEMEADVSIEDHEEKLARVQAGIERLGAINLVAIEEFEELSERKDYLDSQYDDLSRAVQMLEDAIHKIDKETRELFKKTFEQINVNLQNTFPRLFGGGEAHLELTERDLLTTGVTIMVHPPGKRRVSINLLSGGEKALSAAAVVFSIFELNPAPFCLLDEVDAPLDEHNVERFCDLIKHMAGRVQFIVITHNKISMEYMDSLIGVTMQEPGVSRLVAVDVEEAAKMATA